MHGQAGADAVAGAVVIIHALGPQGARASIDMRAGDAAREGHARNRDQALKDTGMGRRTAGRIAAHRQGAGDIGGAIVILRRIDQHRISPGRMRRSVCSVTR